MSEIKYTFKIMIVEEDEEKCTKIFNRISLTKVEYIKDYIESMRILNHRLTEEESADAKLRGERSLM